MLSIVIPAHGSVPRLRWTLTSLVAASGRVSSLTEIIVVNDGANSEINECVHSFSALHSDIRLIEISRGGRSVARNRGAEHAKGDRILFLDADVLCSDRVLSFHASLGPTRQDQIYRGAIAHMLWLAPFDDPIAGTLTEEGKQSLNMSGSSSCALSSRLLTAEAVQCPDLLQPLSRTPKFQRDLQMWFLTKPSDTVSSWIGCTGGQFSIARSVFHQLGGFDEAMGLRWGAEDLEFGYRAVASGIRVCHAARSVCYHMDHSSRGRVNDHEWACRYFASKHNNDGILKLLDYFDNKCTLATALEACYAGT